jgi:hypothetical protein
MIALHVLLCDMVGPVFAVLGFFGVFIHFLQRLILALMRGRAGKAALFLRLIIVAMGLGHIALLCCDERQRAGRITVPGGIGGNGVASLSRAIPTPANFRRGNDRRFKALS